MARLHGGQAVLVRSFLVHLSKQRNPAVGDAIAGRGGCPLE
jgi:hypothetical protein